MCWAGVIEGQLIIHGFDNNVSVNGQTYLDMLKEKVWPKIRNLASRRMYWFQQDGEAVHITNGVREWLNKTFHGRVISRMMEHPWPTKSPDLSPLDYWFWNVAMFELRRAPPRDIGELKTTVNAFAESLDYANLEKCVSQPALPKTAANLKEGSTV